jgi:hypothetical protein
VREVVFPVAGGEQTLLEVGGKDLGRAPAARRAAALILLVSLRRVCGVRAGGRSRATTTPGV